MTSDFFFTTCLNTTRPVVVTINELEQYVKGVSQGPEQMPNDTIMPQITPAKEQSAERGRQTISHNLLQHLYR